MTLYTGRLNLYTDLYFMFKRFSFLLCISLILSACVFDKSKNTGVNKELKGLWEQDPSGFTLLSINNDRFMTLYYVDTYKCYSPYNIIILSSSDKTITLEGYNSGTFDENWEVKGDELTLKNEQGSRTFSKSSSTESEIELCSNEIALKTTHISIKFKNLPDFIQVNHPSTEEDDIELWFDIHLDLNSNNTLDNGDIKLYLHHTKEAGAAPELKNSEHFFAISVLVEPIDGGQDTRWAPLTAHRYAIDNNTLTLQFPVSAHTAFAAINPNMSLKVYINYLDQSGKDQYDQFPDTGRVTPSGTDLSNMLDNSDDVYSTSSEPIIVDIQGISIQFIE